MKLDKDYISHFHDNGLYIPTRTIYVGPQESEGETDCKVAENAIKNLHILDNNYNSENPITIVMNNPGGNVPDGLAIYDAIRRCKNEVRIVVYGQASSMGSIILQAADPGQRIVSPFAEVMVHHGNIRLEGHPEYIRRALKKHLELDEKIKEIFLEKIREKKTISPSQFYKKCEHDWTLYGSEAVEWGLADIVLGEE